MKVADKIYAEYEDRRLQKVNVFLTDLVRSRFSDILSGLDAIESSEALNNELQKDRLLKSDIGTIVRQLTPYVPALGILSCGITTSKHVYSHIIAKHLTRQTLKAHPTTVKNKQ